MKTLKSCGKAAIVVPEGVLFQTNSAFKQVKQELLENFNLHTILSLPAGVFLPYSGVKTNVLFFTKGSAKDKHQEENCTENVWVYDLRTNMPSFGKRTPFGNASTGFAKDEFGTDPHLGAFEKVFGDLSDGTSKRSEGEYSFGAQEIEVDKEVVEENLGIDDRLAHSRWRSFSREWIRETKGDSLDISWLKDKDSVDAADLPEPNVLAQEAKAELKVALAELDGLLIALGEAQ